MKYGTKCIMRGWTWWGGGLSQREYRETLCHIRAKSISPRYITALAEPAKAGRKAEKTPSLLKGHFASLHFLHFPGPLVPAGLTSVVTRYSGTLIQNGVFIFKMLIT